MKNKAFLVLFAGLFFCLAACVDDKDGQGQNGDLTQYTYKPTPYQITKPSHFPEMAIPADNPFTEQGISLGRMLFYDPILSADSSQSCSSCHLPSGSFTDNKMVSTGIDGVGGNRSSMSLLNIGFVRLPLFWDGRTATLEEQALEPVIDPIEMHNTWANALEDLRAHDTYSRMFREAFGMSNKSEITKEHAAKAIAQFERTIISSGKSKYDQFMATNDANVFDDDEFDGMVMYFDKAVEIGSSLPDGECFHCHGGAMAGNFNFFNNGLQSAQSVNDYPDKGQGAVLNNPKKNGNFRSPSLLNIALTAPYFHNGTAQTLEQVVEHYSEGGKPSPNKDILIHKLGVAPNFQGLTPKQKGQIVKFLHTMTDTAAINNPALQNPFK
jgi:cytochrome c peroxidase